MIIKRSILARVAMLYILFGAVIAIGVVMSFNKAAFSEGFNVGNQMVSNHSSAGQEKIAIPEILFDQNVTSEKINIVTDSIAGSCVSASVSKINITIERDSVEKQYIISLCLSILSMLVYVAIFVVIFLILASLLKSIRSGEVFSHRNIAYTRLIAILLIVASLLTSFAFWIDAHIAEQYIDGSIYKIDTTFSPDFAQLITAILIFVMAEVFAIGAKLSDEQKLTI